MRDAPVVPAELAEPAAMCALMRQRAGDHRRRAAIRVLPASDTGLQGQTPLLAAAPGHDADRAATEASAALALATAVRRAKWPPG